MSDIGTLVSFSDGVVLYAAQLNSNFSDIRTAFNTYGVQTDKASQTITKTLTFNPDSGAAITVTTGGITVTAGGITITAGGQTITAGNLALTAGNLTFGAASAKVIPGATSLLFRNNADNASNLVIADNGDLTVRGTVTGITSLAIGGALSGVTTLAASGNITHTGSKVIVNSTSWAIRNAADTITAFGITGNTTSTAITMTSGTSAGIVLTAGPSGGGVLNLNQSGGNDVSLSNTQGNIALGGGVGISTSATTNIPSMPTCAGTPTGGGSLVNGAFVLDSTNSRLYVRVGGAWKYAALT